MFDLKTSCSNCPFRKGKGEKFRLNPGRLEEIRTSTAFQCHKTLEGKPQQCAGLMAVLHREGTPNQIMQVATRLKVLEPSKLDPRSKAYQSWEDVLIAHKR